MVDLNADIGDSAMVAHHRSHAHKNVEQLIQWFAEANHVPYIEKPL
jgi:hypothetical protein